MATIEFSLNMAEMQPLMAEFVARAKACGGAEECERRIGRSLDEMLARDFFVIVTGEKPNELRAKPTAEFDRCLLALW